MTGSPRIMRVMSAVPGYFGARKPRRFKSDRVREEESLSAGAGCGEDRKGPRPSFRQKRTRTSNTPPTASTQEPLIAPPRPGRSSSCPPPSSSTRSSLPFHQPYPEAASDDDEPMESDEESQLTLTRGCASDGEDEEADDRAAFLWRSGGRTAYGTLYSDPTPEPGKTTTEAIKEQISAAHDAASRLVGKLLDRGANMKDMKAKAASLETAGSMFRRTGRNVESEKWWQAHK
ncbi:hypothetical protein BDK51DRAFT_32462, partial [Blyttiomyces helicus]